VAKKPRQLQKSSQLESRVRSVPPGRWAQVAFIDLRRAGHLFDGRARRQGACHPSERWADKPVPRGPHWVRGSRSPRHCGERRSAVDRLRMKSDSFASAHEVLAGLVERVTFHNAENWFCVLRTKARGHRDLVTVVGEAASISAGEWITASGEWVNDRNHGQQFRARFFKTWRRRRSRASRNTSVRE
jgi:hypothetical protein